MTGLFLRSTKLRQSLLGQLVAVVLLLQPVANIAQADLAARNPWLAQVLASLCAPSSSTNDERTAGQAMQCCTFAGQCGSAACCAGALLGGGSRVDVRDGNVLVAAGNVVATRTGASHLWPAATGPPSS